MRYIHTHDTIHMIHFVPVRLPTDRDTVGAPPSDGAPLSPAPSTLREGAHHTRSSPRFPQGQTRGEAPSSEPLPSLRSPRAGLTTRHSPRGTDLRHRPCARRADGRLTGCVPPCLPSRPDPSIQANPLHPGVGAHSRSGCARAINRRAQPQWLRACLEPRSYRAQGAGAV